MGDFHEDRWGRRFRHIELSGVGLEGQIPAKSEFQVRGQGSDCGSTGTLSTTL